MDTFDCPFHVECRFPKSAKKTESHAMLEERFCFLRYEDCDIAQRILAGLQVPKGASPDGSVCK